MQVLNNLWYLASLHIFTSKACQCHSHSASGGIDPTNSNMGKVVDHRITVQLCALLLLFMCLSFPGAAQATARKGGASGPPKGISLSFPPFTSALNCSIDGSADVPPEFVCTPGQGPPAGIFLSNDNGAISARYQYNPKVQLYQKKSRYAASFSTSYTVMFRRSGDRKEDGNFNFFGGGLAFAITPDQRVGASGQGSFGLFEINEDTGKSLRGKKTKTVAVAVDVTANVGNWDNPQVPHLELDINGVDSVVDTFLWDRTAFLDTKVAYFIDYDARKEQIAVRAQNITGSAKASKKHAKLLLTYSGLKLSDYVNAKSVVGFSARVPETDQGTYVIIDWKFSTKWVLTSKLH